MQYIRHNINLCAFYIVLGMVLLPLSSLYSATTGGTIISNTALLTGNNIASTNSPIIFNAVSTNYGFDIVYTPGNVYISPGHSSTNIFRITNRANQSDPNISIIVSNFTLTGWTSGNWIAQFYHTGGTVNFLGITNTQPTTRKVYTVPSLGEDSYFEFWVIYTISAGANAGANGYTPISIETSSAPSFRYTGDNSTNYGGTNHFYSGVRGHCTNTIGGPLIVMEKSISNLSGDPVPGTRITYKLEYDNDGIDPAAQFVIEDIIPSHTALVVGSITIHPHTGGGAFSIDYNNGTGWGYAPAGTIDRNVRRLRIAATGSHVAADNGDGAGVQGDPPDADGGFITFEVEILPRNE